MTTHIKAPVAANETQTLGSRGCRMPQRGQNLSRLPMG